MKMDVLVSFTTVHHTLVLSMQQKGHIRPLLISRPSQTVWDGDYPSNLRLKLIKDGPFRTKSVRELFV